MAEPSGFAMGDSKKSDALVLYQLGLLRWGKTEYGVRFVEACVPDILVKDEENEFSYTFLLRSEKMEV